MPQPTMTGIQKAQSVGGNAYAYGKTGTTPPQAKKRPTKTLGSFKKGGKVKKTGKYKLHKGEKVLTKKQAKKFNAGGFEKARRAHFKMGKKS